MFKTSLYIIYYLFRGKILSNVILIWNVSIMLTESSSCKGIWILVKLSCNNTISIFLNSFATNSGHEIHASSIILRKLDDWLQRSKIWRNVKARNHLLCLLVFNGFLVLSHYMSQCSECFISYLKIHFFQYTLLYPDNTKKSIYNLITVSLKR